MEQRLNLRQNKRGAALSDVSYISLPNSGRPILFISPRYVGKSARFSMNSVAILSDDVVVFEKKFSFLDVATNLDSSLIGAHDLVDQSISLKASEEEVSSLSNITTKSVVAIRIYDDSGYIVLEKILLRVL
ncbi:MAG: hypothetical protein IPL70_08935 [Uliginosibacterium sp.]|nr:hypothetical protein [Uliginosibacterium sp.]